MASALLPPLGPARADRRRHAGRASLAVGAAPGDQRFVVVILRGALDGMAAVVPYGDPGLASLRGELVPAGARPVERLLDLGGFYGLHPSLANLHTMFKAGELLPVHAVVGPTRVRSHFEAQDCLESGADHRMTSGWLNRAVAALPAAAHGRPEGDALAIGVVRAAAAARAGHGGEAGRRTAL